MNGKKSEFSIHIQGSTIGAMAVGPGATASSSGAPRATPDAIRATVEIHGALPAWASRRLRAMADAIDRNDFASVARSDALGSIAWTIDVEGE